MNSINLSNLSAQVECYKILVRLFDMPEAGVHDNRKLYNDLIKATGYLKPKALELAKKLRKTIADVSIEDLTSEYRRLLGGSEIVLANPSCDFYFSNRENTAGSQAWVREFYEIAGFRFEPEIHSPCHISTELRFIGYLLDQITNEFNRNNLPNVNHFGDLRCRFVHEHMILWVPEFTRCILYNSKSPFYLQLAILLRTLLVTCSGEEENPDE